MTRNLATVSLVLTAFFVIVILALHVLRPDVDPAVFGISFYGLGRFGQLFGLAVSVVGLSGIALAISLRSRFPSSPGRAGIALLFLWGVTSILAGLFPLDAPGTPSTISGTIHNLSGLNFLFIVPALLLIELRPSKDRVVTGPRPTTYWLAWLILFAATSLFVFNGPLNFLNIGGVIQRLYWLVLVLWLFLKAAQSRNAVRQRKTRQ